MKLYYSPTSPYARKCLVLAIEKSLVNQVELVNLSPWDNLNNLLQVNPLCKVPALELDDGSALCDSPLILGIVTLIGFTAKLRLLANGRHVHFQSLSFTEECQIRPILD